MRASAAAAEANNQLRKGCEAPGVAAMDERDLSELLAMSIEAQGLDDPAAARIYRPDSERDR